MVDKAYDKLAETLGEHWQKNYIVWDMCCGVGNLEVKHSNPRNIYMSTLDQADVDVMIATKTCVAAQRFQYDYLNDDIVTEETLSSVRGEPVEPHSHPSTSSGRTVGSIDYSLTNKVPAGLRQAIAEGKKILVLINPPYAEATSSDNLGTGGEAQASKTGVAKTKLAATAMAKFGKASNELFTQFVARVALEMPTATLAMFSKLKYVNSQTLVTFRDVWNANYLNGFVVHSKVFDGLKGDFPIGFLIWATNQNCVKKQPIVEIVTEVYDRNVQAIGEKCFYNLSSDKLLTNWISRPKTNKKEVIPLKNAITPATATKDLRGTKWSDCAIAFLWCNSNDMQQAPRTALFSSGFNGGHGIFINSENLWQAAVIFSVRRLSKANWINDIDQFLQPTEPLTDEFKTDCLIWMLFNGSNLTASANVLEWNNQKWSIVNHFIPFTEAEVNAPARFESDFMVQYLTNLPALTLTPNVIPAQAGIQSGLIPASVSDNSNNETCLDSRLRGNDEVVGNDVVAENNRSSENDGIASNEVSGYSGLSAEANAVLKAGQALWQAYFAHTDVRNVRDKLKLNRPDVGWYQIRNALKARNASGDFAPINFAEFETAYKGLGDKLRPQVYTLGFLRV